MAQPLITNAVISSITHACHFLHHPAFAPSPRAVVERLTASILLHMCLRLLCLQHKLDEAIELMEKAIVGGEFPAAIMLVIGTVLLMTMASLRFDDALHSPPDLMSLRVGALFGVAWQTRVERGAPAGRARAARSETRNGSRSGSRL